MATPAPHPPEPASASRPSLVARCRALPGALWSWTRASRLRLIAATIGLVAVIGFSVGATLYFSNQRQAPVRLLAEGYAALDAGDWKTTRQRAAAVLVHSHTDPAERGGAYYLLGAVTAHEAENQAREHRRILHLIAARYLDEARTRGIPPTRQARALDLLGRSLLEAGRYERAIAVLQEYVKLDPAAEPRMQRLLAECYAHCRPPRLAEALAAVRAYLALSDLAADDRDGAVLLEARILRTQGDQAGALAAARRIDETSPLFGESLVLQAQLQVETWREGLDQGSGASPEALVADLQRLSERRGISAAAQSAARLLLALVHLRSGQREAARLEFERLRRLAANRPEGLAALAYLAEMAEPGDALTKVALLKRALAQAGPLETYDNPWLTADELQRRVEAVIDELTRQEQYPAALELSAALAPPFAPAVGLVHQSQVERAWARHLADQARRAKPDQAPVIEAEARQHWRQAGALTQRLAEARIASREYLDDLARAADDFRLGQGYHQAVSVYRLLLKQESVRDRPEVLVGLGESLLALGQAEAALAALGECRDTYPRHPVTYRARLLAAIALEERGQASAAKELLIDNLYRYSLAPQSTDWRDSLFALGMLLYRQGLVLECKSRLEGVDRLDADARRAGLALLEQAHTALEEAIQTLREAVQRYPTAQRATEAQYCIAEAHRHSAKWPRKRLATVSIETSRASLVRQMQEHLQAAVGEYSSLISRLSQQPDAGREATEAAILRNCYFARADALFDLGKYPEAIAAYSAATNRYQHDPASLEAYVQIASCYRRQGRHPEARGTLDQALVVLGRIRPDADFTRTTRLARADWAQLLSWLRAL